MARNERRVSESEVALATLRVAATRDGGVATYDELRDELPNYLDLSAADRRRSLTRQNEEIWEQKIRNLKSHYQNTGNILFEGYAEHIPDVGFRITTKGRRYLASQGY